MHHVFLRAAKVQPKSGQGHGSCPHAGSMGSGYVPQHLGITGLGVQSLPSVQRQKRSSLRAAWLESPAAEQCGDAPQVGLGKRLPSFLLQRCHQQLQTSRYNTWSNGCNGFWARVPRHPWGSLRTGGEEMGAR